MYVREKMFVAQMKRADVARQEGDARLEVSGARRFFGSVVRGHLLGVGRRRETAARSHEGECGREESDR